MQKKHCCSRIFSRVKAKPRGWSIACLARGVISFERVRTYCCGNSARTPLKIQTVANSGQVALGTGYYRLTHACRRVTQTKTGHCSYIRFALSLDGVGVMHLESGGHLANNQTEPKQKRIARSETLIAVCDRMRSNRQLFCGATTASK